MRYGTWEPLSAIIDPTSGSDHAPRELLGMAMRTVGHHVMDVLRFATMCYSGPTVDAFVDVLMRSYPSDG